MVHVENKYWGPTENRKGTSMTNKQVAFNTPHRCLPHVDNRWPNSSICIA